MNNSTDYQIRFRQISEYLKIVCYSYPFPLFKFVHDSHIKELRDKLYHSIRAKLHEDYANTFRNNDYDYAMEQLEKIRKELDSLMIE